MMFMVTLTGCISLLPEAGPAPEYVSLNPDLPTNKASKHNFQIIIEEPTADILHNSNKIVVLNCQQYKFAEGKEWSERLPIFVQRDIVKAISKKGLLGVGIPANGLKPNYILLSNISKFLVATKDHDHPKVLIEADFSLMQIPSRKIVARKHFSGSEVSAKGFGNILKGFNVVYENMLDEVSDWVIVTSQPSLRGA